ncbi:hypothetical protein LTR53_014229 [Teratosphaeriaceae sp. CCFEE 6253]|nr:hypothetical protein LTR53_014229 [Teratosphaeriaceae sp. CCFEE 6253]
MSLYHEAAQILDSTTKSGVSIKSLVYDKKRTWNSDPKSLFALSTEAAKWSAVLSEVLQRSGVLKLERQLSPTLALVLTYDLLLSKRGVALPASHGLHAAIAKHKARLSAELTKARLRRGCATVEALRASVDVGAAATSTNGGGDAGPRRVLKHPRWVRINSLKTSLDEQLAATFAEYKSVATLGEVLQASSKVYHIDEQIPNLLAIPALTDITSSLAYKSGKLILQDKASCFPAYLLDPKSGEGDVIDACAAPGNKTTHCAAILTSRDVEKGDDTHRNKIIACEKDILRSETLAKMLKVAGADGVVTVKAKQDFTKLPPDAKQFVNVTALLLDPSCSGSGIVGRDEGAGITVHLPDPTATPETATSRGKKRKRAPPKPAPPPPTPVHAAEEEQAPLPDNAETADKLAARLASLQAFQLRLLTHAMAFPAARRIVYSTCSVHAEENEHVVVAALMSEVGREKGWRVLRRGEQVEGMRGWHLRGLRDEIAGGLESLGMGEQGTGGMDSEEIAEACLRCDKTGEDGTMGFFVVGFVRDRDAEGGAVNGAKAGQAPTVQSPDEDGVPSGDVGEEEGEWEGFDDGT